MPGFSMTVQEAIAKAKEHLAITLPEFAGAEWRLEEIETAARRPTWLLTFTASTDRKTSSDMTLADFIRPFRVSKVVELDSETGDLLAIRNKAA